MSCFNEAGPQGAGKRGLMVARGRPWTASMRPARKGPENDVGPFRGRERGRRFNEAGPQGAGKLQRMGRQYWEDPDALQ